MEYTAEELMRDLWYNLKESHGEEITIDRNYLYQTVLNLQRDSFERGYHKGYIHGLETGRGENTEPKTRLTWAYDFIEE